MPDALPILHHYPASPFAEKIRLALGIKGLKWGSADQPSIMPKPELVALTGGYRRIPVMQFGADIYCDTRLILDELERRFPEPTLHPDGAVGLNRMLAHWTDTQMFQTIVSVVFGRLDPDSVPADFRADREALRGQRWDTQAMRAALPFMTRQLRAQLAMIDEQLQDGRAFLSGDRPSMADIHAYFCPWFLRSTRTDQGILQEFSHLPAWYQRLEATGSGSPSEISRRQSLDIAAAAEPSRPGVVAGEGFARGDRVVVQATDYGRDPIEGSLVGYDLQAMAVRRPLPAGGEVTVHFPCIGYLLQKAG